MRKIKITQFTKSCSKQIHLCDAGLHHFTVITLSLHGRLLYRTANKQKVANIGPVTFGSKSILWEKDVGTKVNIMFKYLLFYPALIEALNQVPCRYCDNRAD